MGTMQSNLQMQSNFLNNMTFLRANDRFNLQKIHKIPAKLRRTLKNPQTTRKKPKIFITITRTITILSINSNTFQKPQKIYKK
jgi:hypothetical protein